MELSSHQYLRFLQTNQILRSGVMQLGLEEICCSLWVIALHLSSVLFNYGLNLMEAIKKVVSVSSVLTNCMHHYSKCMSQSIIRSRGTRIVLVSTHVFRSNPIFMVRLQVANIRGSLEPLSCQGSCSDPALLKDGLNFVDGPLKTIGFLQIMFWRIASAKCQGAT